MKKTAIAVVAIFVAWTILDMLVHGFLLMPTYNLTPELWRPSDEMNPFIFYAVNLVAAIAITLIYALLFKERGLKSGILYGLLLGIAIGALAGFASYGYLPISLYLAQAWFATEMTKQLVAGLLLGAILRS